MPLPHHPTTRDGRAVALDNELRVLRALRHFGHLRRTEVGMAVWPKSTPKSAYAMAWKTVGRLLLRGQVIERPNTLGGYSLVLGARGVARLRDHDIVASEGYDLASDGPQFFHRTLGTNYLLERARSGLEVFGEYALLKDWSPLSRDYLRERFRKLPDGIILHPGPSVGLREGLRAADWVEVESAYKPYDDVARALKILTTDSTLNKAGTIVLNKLVFAYDTRQNHEKQLLRYLRRFLRETPNLSKEIVLKEIVFARCHIDVPLTWHGVEELTAAQLWQDETSVLHESDDDALPSP